MTKISINENERKILEAMSESYDSSGWDETGYFPFNSLMGLTKLDRKIVRRACRSLARKGLAKYLRGLWNDDGPAGAGYGATREGAALISPCDVCGDLATQDYFADSEGKLVISITEGAKHILRCEKHQEKP